MIYVSKIYLPRKEKLLSYIDEIYESGWLTNNGPLVQKLEKCLEDYLGVKNLLVVGNGTVGLQLAIQALQLTGEAITTPFSFASTPCSLAKEHVNPIFADIDPETLNLDPSNIEEAITERTSAIMPVHVFGNPCEIDKIEEIAERRKLKVIYDASHAFDVNYKGKSVLAYGDISVISFHATKIFHTIEGGAIIVKDDEVYKRAKILRNYGIDGPDSIAFPGINGKMNEFEAAMGLCNLDEMETILAERKCSYDYYHRELDGLVSFQKWNVDANHSLSYISAIFRSFEEMDRVREALAALQIYPRQYFSPSLDTVDFGVPQKIMRHSRDIASRILVLPLHSNAEVEVCRVIKELLV